MGIFQRSTPLQGVFGPAVSVAGTMETDTLISGLFTVGIDPQGTFIERFNLIGNVSMVKIAGEMINEISITGQPQNVVLTGNFNNRENLLGVAIASTPIDGNFIMEIAM
jgi:hypothetical protein